MNRAISSFFVLSLFLGTALTSVAFVPSANAGTVLKSIEPGTGADGKVISFQFDRVIEPRQIKVEFAKDTIQINFEEASVYPARIQNLGREPFAKVFTYQYTPKVVRARISVTGDASKLRDRFKVTPNGRTVTANFSAAATANRSPAPAAEVAALQRMVKKTEIPVEAETKIDEKTRSQLLKSIVGSAEPQLASPVEVPAPKGLGMAAKKERASPWRVFLMLPLVIGAVLVGAGAVFVAKRRGAQARIGSFLKRVKIPAIQSLMKTTRNRKMIEIIANHSLGPKKNIAIVRVQGQTLVLGVTQDNISLITQMNGDSSMGSGEHDGASEGSPDLAAAMALLSGGQKETQTFRENTDQFRSVLSAEATKQVARPEAPIANGTARDRIRARIQGMKAL